YYHSDHLGSAQFVTDWKGRQYEHIEYTPYGELWIEETAPGIDKLPFRFTGKELDEETGLYYYGARYLDPKYSRWLSGDPALNDYIPKAPIDDEAKKHNENLPGMGGVFNIVNLHLYHYAGNNPVKYIDPDGENIAFFVNPELAGGNGHTSLYFQDVKGQWYKFDQGAAGEPSSGSGGIGYLFSYLPAGVSIEKVDKLPDGIEEIQTTLYQDYLISNNASEVQKAHNSGKVDYQLCSNNCTDAAVETVNDSGSGIKIPNPATTIKPNSWYKNEYKPWLKQNKDQTKHTPYGPYPLDYYKQLQNKERDIDVNK
ncbi:RHS repeat domain-containing protein, partial [Treponema pedis]|uniref:RHS repeat domain-containing protein n=2 Tax=Treponema pedis TaxID=409322 RepID=UPI001CEF59CD